MATVHDLAHARLEAADVLQAAISMLGTAYVKYLEATAALAQRTGLELETYLRVPISLALARAGLRVFLEQKLAGPPSGLRAAVERQHQKLGLEAHVQDAPASDSRSQG